MTTSLATAPKWHGLVIVGIAMVLGVSIIASLLFISRNLDILSKVIESNTAGNPHFAWSSMGVLGQISLRILAIYFGAAAMLAGTATAFYSVADKTSASGEGKGISLALATASPGIAAVAAGAMVICIAVTTAVQASYSGENRTTAEPRNEAALKDFPAAVDALKAPVAAPKQSSSSEPKGSGTQGTP